MRTSWLWGIAWLAIGMALATLCLPAVSCTDKRPKRSDVSIGDNNATSLWQDIPSSVQEHGNVRVTLLTVSRVLDSVGGIPGAARNSAPQTTRKIVVTYLVDVLASDNTSVCTSGETSLVDAQGGRGLDFIGGVPTFEHQTIDCSRYNGPLPKVSNHDRAVVRRWVAYDAVFLGDAPVFVAHEGCGVEPLPFRFELPGDFFR